MQGYAKYQHQRQRKRASGDLLDQTNTICPHQTKLEKQIRYWLWRNCTGCWEAGLRKMLLRRPCPQSPKEIGGNHEGYYWEALSTARVEEIVMDKNVARKGSYFSDSICPKQGFLTWGPWTQKKKKFLFSLTSLKSYLFIEKLTVRTFSEKKKCYPFLSLWIWTTSHRGGSSTCDTNWHYTYFHTTFQL